ncbi:MAG TPA: PEGA domain-containing protein [Polyangia bacterium]|nr:PEGA domain-containing protein [Polyangia bacterium]
MNPIVPGPCPRTTRSRAFWLAALLAAFLGTGSSAQAQKDDPAEQARQHYQAGVSLFEAGNKEQALVEFQLAHDLVPKKANLFMIAQCQYHLGLLKEARANYQEFLAQPSSGELADIARMRIEAINHRPGVMAINTAPDQVQVRIEGEGQVFLGEAPNEFRVPRGRYRVTVSKPNFVRQERDITIDVAETKPLFFKLDPIPARLEIHTSPSNATLYVRGNRTQNPFAQFVDPGDYEIYAEANYHIARHDVVSLAPGQQLKVDFPLSYLQRSGRPELIGFWIGIGAIGGGMAVTTRLSPGQAGNLTLVGAGALAGGIGAGVISAALVPAYIRDNLALFRISGGWIGDVEGLSLGLALTQSVSGAWLGGVVGLSAGSVLGWWLDDRAPNYGRVAVIQSGAFLGAVAGVLAIPTVGFALKSTDSSNTTTIRTDRVGWGMLAGMNLGLATGLALAYLPDQRSYGPSWQRVMLIDLAAVAGGFTGALLQMCVSGQGNKGVCGDVEIGPQMARYALAGSAVGLATGLFLTWNYDKHDDKNGDKLAQTHPARGMPLPGALPVQTTDGRWALVPGLVSQGQF